VKPFVAHYSGRKLLLAGLGALAFAAVSVLVLTRRAPSFLDIAGGTAALLFFGLCAVIVAVRLFDRRAVLVIDEHGIFDRRAKDRSLAWALIAHIAATRIGRQRLYLIQPSVPLMQFTDRRYKRALQVLNRPWTGRGFFVGASGLDVSFEQIADAIHHFRPRS
jgi:hypothetical protein